MAARAIPRERFEELYGPGWDAEYRTPAAAQAVNQQAVLQLYESIPLVWDGITYTVAPISYLDGVRFAGLDAVIKRAAVRAPTTEGEREAFELALLDGIERMGALLRPEPEENPFLDASPLEVGQLLGFFSMCLTMQSASGRSRLGPVSPSIM